MYHSDLFNEVLVRPAAEKGADRLLILSGYATAGMLSRHKSTLRERELDVAIELIVGMTPRDGISLTDHEGFRAFLDADFSCRYVVTGYAVHSKLYIWLKGRVPCIAYAGSANYTQTAFFEQRELVANVDPSAALDYFYAVEKDSRPLTHEDIQSFVQIHGKASDSRLETEARAQVFSKEVLKKLESATVSLLASNGTMHKRSGLNWGQRPELKRNPDQAYIPVNSPLRNTDFFPERGVHFTAYTDDGHVLVLSRAQDGGKAIHTPWDNSHLGQYFRRRLGVPSGEPVLREHLERYGRTDVTFYKLDKETYYMDFSVPKSS